MQPKQDWERVTEEEDAINRTKFSKYVLFGEINTPNYDYFSIEWQPTYHLPNVWH